MTPPSVLGAVLEIVSVPEAEVVWEGVSLGLTDSGGLLSVDEAPPGAYTLLLRKAGYQPISVRVEIGANKRTLFLNLEPLSALSAEPVVESSPGYLRLERTAARGEVASLPRTPALRPDPPGMAAETPDPVHELSGESRTGDATGRDPPRTESEPPSQPASAEPAPQSASLPPPSAQTGRPWGTLLLAAATLAGITAGLALLWRRRHEAPALRRSLPLLGRGLGLERLHTPRQRRGGDGFLRELRRREEDLEEGQVIDVEVLDVSSIEADERGR